MTVLFKLTQGSSGAGEGFEVTKYGHGRVALIGFPRSVMPVALISVLVLEKKKPMTELLIEIKNVVS